MFLVAAFAYPRLRKNARLLLEQWSIPTALYLSSMNFVLFVAEVTHFVCDPGRRFAKISTQGLVIRRMLNAQVFLDEEKLRSLLQSMDSIYNCDFFYVQQIKVP